jgi:hypothetical protein
MKGFTKKIIIAVLGVTLLSLCAFSSDVLAKKRATATHNVTYIYGLKSVTVPVAHGANAPQPTDTYVDGYNFKGWVGNPNIVTEDRVILGAYDKVNPPVVSVAQSIFGWSPKWSNATSAAQPEWWKTLNMKKGTPGQTCAVYWINGWTGELWKTDIVPYGSTLPTPEPPCLSGFDFVGWEGDWTNITEDRVIMACYYVKHKLKFIDGETDDEIDTCYVRDGEGAYPDAPHHHGKEFKGYYESDGGQYNGGGVHRDMTLYAKYVDRND